MVAPASPALFDISCTERKGGGCALNRFAGEGSMTWRRAETHAFILLFLFLFLYSDHLEHCVQFFCKSL